MDNNVTISHSPYKHKDSLPKMETRLSTTITSEQAVTSIFKKITSMDNSKNVNDYVKQWNLLKREALLEVPRKGSQA